MAHCRENVSYGFIDPIDKLTLCWQIDLAKVMIYSHLKDSTKPTWYSQVIDYVLNVIYAPLYSTSHPRFASKVEDLTTFITKGLTSDLMKKECKDLSEQEMLGILELEVEANIYAKGRYLNAIWEKGKKARRIFWKSSDNISAVLENVEQMEQKMDLFHNIVNAFHPTSSALAGLVKQGSSYRDSYNDAVKKWSVLVIRANGCIFASRFCKDFSATYSANVYDPDYYRFLGAMCVFDGKYKRFSDESFPFISAIEKAIESINQDMGPIVEAFKRGISLLQGMTEETNRPEWFPAELWELRGSILRNYSEFKASNHSLLLLASEIAYTETVDRLTTCLVLVEVKPMYDEFTKQFREQAQDIAARMISATVTDVEANCQQLPETAIPFFRKHKASISAVSSFASNLDELNGYLEDTQFMWSFGADSIFSTPKRHLRNASIRITDMLRPLETLYQQEPLLEALASKESITNTLSLIREQWPTITLDNFTAFRNEIENESEHLVEYLESMCTLIATSPLGEDHQNSSEIQKLGLKVRKMLEEIKGNLTTISDSISSKAWVKGTSIESYEVGLNTTGHAYQKKLSDFIAKISAQAELTIGTIDDLLDDTQHLNSAADSSRDTIPTPSSDNSVGDTGSSNRTSTPSVDENETPQTNTSFIPAAGAESGVEPPASMSQRNDNFVPLQQDGPPADLLRRDNPTDTPDIEQENTGESVADILKNTNATEATVDNLAKPQ